MDHRPPPPPHGTNPGPGAKSSGLPPGNYDIFVIPPHASGAGFLYLPSLQPQRNSFLAGVACALAAVGIWAVVLPIIKQWFAAMAASGGAGVVLLILGVGVLGWAWGRTQTESEHTGQPPPKHHPPPPQPDFTGANAQPGHGPQGFTSGFTPGGSTPFGAAPKPSWQKTSTGTGTASSSWEKAREETKKREEERRKKEEAEKKNKEAEQKSKEAAEKERWEKARTREREAREKEAREKIIQERLNKERDDKRREKEAEAARDKAAHPARTAAAAAGSGGYKKPTAHSLAGEDEYSYRPYDQPKRAKPQGSNSSFVSQTGSSWAGSQSTANTTPPPSNRGPFSTKDPAKIQIRAVYEFIDSVAKPVRQLVSGTGNVTDGLVLNMTTEGMFIDDEVRGVGQREWDVKAWTLKLVEVWCNQFAAHCGPVTPVRYALKQKEPGQRFLNNANGKALSSLELDLVIEDLMRVCKAKCPGHQQSNRSSTSQTGDFNGLHVLRACVRDSENKKYVFIIDNGEAWKVAVGLQRLRRGTQVRSLGVSGLPGSECSRLLGTLGWG